MEKVEKNYPYGYCGVYCGQCATGNDRIRIIAGELKRLVDTNRFEWLELPEVKPGFIFSEFRKGLEWFAAAQCPGCEAGGGPPFCKTRKCCKEKQLRSCLLCADYLTCKHTDYHRETYPFVIHSYQRVKEVGFDKWLEEQEKKTRAGWDMCAHLQDKYCKVVKLDTT